MPFARLYPRKVVSTLSVVAFVGATPLVASGGHGAVPFQAQANRVADSDLVVSDALAVDAIAAATQASAEDQAFIRSQRRVSAGVLRRPAPTVARNLPDQARRIAAAKVKQRGWDPSQFQCLDKLWYKESQWLITADNPRSSAYGIPQALPGEKMASAGADWKTNPATQIEWGLGYIADVYGTPCRAWSHSRGYNWY